jgi:enoyl-CoA hydratase/carnithine racemase
MSILTRLTHRKTGTIAHLTISRPTKLNALNTPLLTQLPQAINSLTSQNNDLLCIILTGAGPKAFIGGADIAEMAHLDSPASARSFISKVSDACRSIRECDVPVIGRVNGYALGAGLEVAVSCDVRVASRGAVFGMPEVC